MGKSRAEIQRAYRERLKQKNNEEYLRKERERMRHKYIPSHELSDNDRRVRNEKNRLKLRRFIQRKRAARLRNSSTDHETSGYESGESASNQERGRMKVRMNFTSNRRKGALTRWNRDMSEASARIKQLEEEKTLIQRKLKSAQTSIQRLKKSKEKNSSTEDTPRKQTEHVMNEANLSPSQRKVVKKHLMLGNVLVQEIKKTRENTKISCMKAIHRVISGKIVKKYRCADFLRTRTGLCRHRLSGSDSKTHQIVKATRVSKVKKHQNLVEMFMKREDNSKMQPGKQDVKRIKKGEKAQTYILSDYLTNLFAKFKAENPTINISFTSFIRCRPKYVLTTRFSSRSSCLCTKHQNASLTLKSLRKLGMEIPVNPEKAIEKLPDDDLIRNTLNSEQVPLTQWKRIEVEEKGKKKFVTKLVESKLDKDKFFEHYKTQMEEFSQHVSRVKTQYEQIRILKQSLPQHEMILQLDFAENYSCKSLEEVQSAYFNQTMVTLHPVVVYYRNETGDLEHKSVMIVSDEMGHKASTVLTFISEVMPILRELDSNVSRIHYWSDSPTSQYRNKRIFDLIANHEETYKIPARWNYFEAGHGKGPCDGLGGTCKRLADEAMRSGKVIIQDAKAFFDWALQSTMNNVIFRYVSSDRCTETEVAQEKKKLKPIKGTMKVHAVVGIGNSSIKTRDVSCYCSTCVSGKICDSWSETMKTSVKDCVSEPIAVPACESESVAERACASESVAERSTMTLTTSHTEYDVGDYIAAIYDANWYIGQVSDIDNEDHEIEVNFLEPKKELFQWPRKPDNLWISKNSILCKISNLEATGKSRRMYKLKTDEKEKIIKQFDDKNA